MMTSEVDQLIAIEKGKSHVQHHYRSNLARLGIFSFKNGKLVLHYPVNVNKADDSFIKNVLKEAVKRNIKVYLILLFLIVKLILQTMPQQILLNQIFVNLQ